MTSTATAKGPGLRVATIGGVPVHIGWSWFLLAAVIIVLTGARLVDRTPHAYLIGAGYALSLLLAVLVHEGAHALAARSLGIPVHRVVADFLGGHTAFASTGLTAGRSAVIAAAGPLANALLGGAAWVGMHVVESPVAGLVFLGVTWVNLLLAAFNLLPGLPLDGGQLVEAAVWGASGRRSKGMIAAGWGGRLVAALIVFWALGRPLLAGVTPDTFTLVWAVLLISVIWRGASQAIAVGRSRGLLEGVTVRAAAQRVHLISVGTLVGDLRGIPASVVTLIGDHPDGLLWVPAGSVSDAVPDSAPVSSVASPVPAAAICVAAPDDELWGVLTSMFEGRIGLAVLTHADQIWGAITAQHLDAVLPSIAH